MSLLHQANDLYRIILGHNKGVVIKVKWNRFLTNSLQKADIGEWNVTYEHKATFYNPLGNVQKTVDLNPRTSLPI